MTDENSVNDDDDAVMTDDELALQELKNRADLLKISYHPKIGAENLALKIRTTLAEREAEKSTIPAPTTDTPIEFSKTAVASDEPVTMQVPTKVSNRQEGEKLVRCVVTCMVPMKKAYKGEIFSVGNSVTPTISKYIEFGSPWHVPQMLLNAINEKYFTVCDSVHDHLNRESKKPRQVKAYSIDILEPLSGEELDQLRHVQVIEANGQS